MDTASGGPVDGRALRVHAVNVTAACTALAVTTLILTELLVFSAMLAWGAIGLWDIPPAVAWTMGGAGALLSCRAGLWLFRSTYDVECDQRPSP